MKAPRGVRLTTSGFDARAHTWLRVVRHRIVTAIMPIGWFAGGPRWREIGGLGLLHVLGRVWYPVAVRLRAIRTVRRAQTLDRESRRGSAPCGDLANRTAARTNRR